ncbi:MAG: prephenate dehydrogenase/arogenate dehydrogenase family protein [Chloroflexota bacterium]|nr:prephenate dehydrogenase/arogenate dehydrogenase family protein [Chloroflexota bacterium]
MILKPHDKPLDNLTVAIAGLGLMGGSLAMALRGKVGRVVGIARRRETIEEALAIGAIDSGHTTLAAGLPEADVIVLATPVSVIMQQIDEVGRLAVQGILQPGIVLTDMGSTKKVICDAMATLPSSVEPVGSHPMCGKETSGLTVAEAGLYQNRPWVITSLDRTAPGVVPVVESLAKAVGARPIHLDSQRHDRIVAAISHLPYTVSAALFAGVYEASQSDDRTLELAASGFRSSTRLAGSDARMMSDILLTNRAAVLAQLEWFQAQLTQLQTLIADGDGDALQSALATIRDRRNAFLQDCG